MQPPPAIAIRRKSPCPSRSIRARTFAPATRPALTTTNQLAEIAKTDAAFQAVAEQLQGGPGFSVPKLVRELVESASVPNLPAHRYKPSGLLKREQWESVWDLQRREDAIDAQKGVVLARAFEPLTKAIVRTFEKHDISSIRVIDTAVDEGALIRALKKDPTRNEEEALKEIYKRLRPGEPPTTANAKALLKRLFFDPKRYDLGRVGYWGPQSKKKVDFHFDETRKISHAQMADWEANADRSRKATAAQMAIAPACGGGTCRQSEIAVAKTQRGGEDASCGVCNPQRDR